jgi:hypothetical protein
MKKENYSWPQPQPGPGQKPGELPDKPVMPAPLCPRCLEKASECKCR